MVSRLSSRNIAFIVIGASILIAIIWYFLLYSPAQAQAETLRTEIQDLQAQKTIGETAKRNIVALCASVAEAQAQKAEFLQSLPNTEQVGPLIEALRRQVNGNEGQLSTVSRSSGQTANLPAGVKAMSVTLGVEGTWGAVFSILRSIEGLQRFTKVENVSLGLSGAPNTFNPRLVSQLAMTTYVYDAANRAQAAEQVAPSCQELSAGGTR